LEKRMKILLINNNPVVSRLTALSARKEDIEIDEIQEVTELSSDKYDIVFVDADSWSKDVDDIIADNIKVQKRVLFYAQDDKDDKGSFDMSILKPFLPSEVSAVIRSVEESKPEALSTMKEENHFNILDQENSEVREELFTLNSDKESLNHIDLEDELVKIDASKTVETFDEKLEESFPLMSDALDDELFEKEELKIETKIDDASLKSKDDLFELDLNDDKLSLDDELFIEDKVLDASSENSDLLDFDYEKNDEFDLEDEEVKELISDISSDEKKKENISDILTDETKKEKSDNMTEETKILDGSEIANIKNILDNKSDDSIQLDDLMTTPSPAMVVTNNVDKKVEKKKKSKKSNNGSELHSDILLQTLTSLPIESLRELLSGARVNISIKFPKVK